MEKNNPKWIFVHSTDHPRSKLPDQFLSCNSWHKDRDFPLSSLNYYIGYHRMITGGKNYQARLDSDVGAHCNQKWEGVSMNFQSLSVCIGFDGDVEYPTKLEEGLLQEQIWKWQDEYKIPNERVVFHRVFYPQKTCPGSLITDKWLKGLLVRPEIISDVSPKPLESMCVAQEKELTELKKEVEGYRKWFDWFVKKFS